MDFNQAKPNLFRAMRELQSLAQIAVNRVTANALNGVPRITWSVRAPSWSIKRSGAKEATNVGYWSNIVYTQQSRTQPK